MAADGNQRSWRETWMIVTGDDFGLSRETNAGVMRAFRDGILTGTSLMVAGAARDEAAAMARENPRLDVGLHLAVCRGRSVLGRERLGNIVDAAGDFGKNPVGAGMRYFFQAGVRRRLSDEIRAQIETHLTLVGYLNHIDGHLNFHVHPAIANIVMEAAAEYRVPCMRLPREPVMHTLRVASDHAATKLVEAAIFRTLSRRAAKMMRTRGIRTTDRLFGLHQTGHISEQYVTAILARMKPGTSEFYFHPADDVGATPPSASAQLETQVLTSQRVRGAVERADIGLMSFADLAGRPATSSHRASE
jgi:chitin disaccharide deacetylase